MPVELAYGRTHHYVWISAMGHTVTLFSNVTKRRNRFRLRYLPSAGIQRSRWALKIAVTCCVFGPRVLFWAVGRFEERVAETRWVEMKERKMKTSQNIWLCVAYCRKLRVLFGGIQTAPSRSHTESY